MRVSGWHILDTGSIWLKEFANEMAQLTPTWNWVPEFRAWGHWEKWERIEDIQSPALQVIKFPLQRGYSHDAIRKLLPFQNPLLRRLRQRTERVKETGLICTAPFYAPLAEQWPGPVVYYLTDLTKKYEGMNERQIRRLDQRMCRTAVAVCPNSTRIADYLIEEAGCAPEKITVIPNATRLSNILDRPLLSPAPLPADLAGLERPILGVIGNLAGNMDWLLIENSIAGARDVSWVFVGPSEMKIQERDQAEARERVRKAGGRVRFVGAKPYGELGNYARAFDAALLPYKKKEPTFSGSATRFYEHLAACRPILATRGFHELLAKEPLLRLVDGEEELVSALEQLRCSNFSDGLERARWQASQHGTWRTRACDLLKAAEQALEPEPKGGMDLMAPLFRFASDTAGNRRNR